MTLAVILARKGSGIVATTPDETLGGIARLMSEKGIGALPVTGPGDRLLGIVSERDIVRSIARRGADVLDERVVDHMTARVKTATADMSVIDAMGLMTEGRFRHLPVMEGERIRGFVSIGDLVKHRLSEMEHENKAMLDYIAAV